jgi:hypothetical protein
VQALLGTISPNFRLVALGNLGGRWQLRFVLEHESLEDREEIEDIGSLLESMIKESTLKAGK